jgi:hypothetical protein
LARGAAGGVGRAGARVRGHLFISAFAFSSQYVMPISRYIVVAVVKCSSDCARLSVRR